MDNSETYFAVYLAKNTERKTSLRVGFHENSCATKKWMLQHFQIFEQKLFYNSEGGYIN